MITLDLFNKKLTESVAEGVDSEELANEVYAEFERIYPNLARRAGERTVHAAIMDVLNYGGDSDPSALAQDVARAVKQDLQGVAEGSGYNIDQDDHDEFTPDEIEKIKQAHFPDTLRSNLRAKKAEIAKRERFNKLKGSDAGSDSNLITPVGSSSDNTYEGVAEGDSLGDTMAKLAKEKFPNALIRKDGETVQQAPRREVPKAASAPVDRAALAKQLKSLQAEFDPDYDRSDDHGYWTKQRGIAQRINSIKRQLSQDVKEATPSWADPKSADYVGRREAARRMSAQTTKPTTPPAPQWTSASKSQPSSIKYAAKKPAKQSTAKQAEPTDRLTPAEYIKRIGAPNLPEAAAENKKKEADELGPQVRDVGLQRAITRAKSDFPTAGSGLEALAKDFMRSQDADQKALDQLRQAERKQDSMLSQISKLDQEQEQEINDLEQQNSTLAQRLQKLQSVNSQLEKKLTAMSGRREKRQADKAKPEPTSSTIDIGIPVSAKTATKDEPKTNGDSEKAKKYKDAVVKSIKADPRGVAGRMLARPEEEPELEPGTQAFAQMTPQLGQQQKSLPLDTTDNVLPATIGKQQNPKYAAAKAGAEDLPIKYSKLAKQLASDPEEFAKAMGTVSENNKEQEVDYDDPRWDAMVQRVGQKAREQEKTKPVDIKDLARRLAGVKLKDEK